MSTEFEDDAAEMRADLAEMRAEPRGLIEFAFPGKYDVDTAFEMGYELAIRDFERKHERRHHGTEEEPLSS